MLSDAVADVIAEAERILEEHGNEPYPPEVLAHGLLSVVQQLRACLRAADQGATLTYDTAPHPMVLVEQERSKLREQKAQKAAQAPPPDHELLEVMAGSSVTGQVAARKGLYPGTVFQGEDGLRYRVRQLGSRRFVRVEEER